MIYVTVVTSFVWVAVIPDAWSRRVGGDAISGSVRALRWAGLIADRP